MQHSSLELREFYLIAITRKQNSSDKLDQRDGLGEVVRNVAESRDVPTSAGPTPRCEPARITKQAELPISSKLDSTCAHTGCSKFRSPFGNVLPTRKGSPCNQCRIQGISCGLQRPSCWKCQQFSYPCYYDQDEANAVQEPDYQRIGTHVDQDADPLLWQDSLKAHPYSNLEWKEKLSRIDRKSLRRSHGRLSKQRPRKKAVRFDVEENLADGYEALLGGSSLTESEVDFASCTHSPPPTECGQKSPRLGSPYNLTLLANSESRTTTTTPASYRPSTVWTDPPTSRSVPTTSGTVTTVAADPGTFSFPVDMASLDDALGAFQCTFCLERCNGQLEWELHELSQHIPDEIWICMPSGPIEKANNNVCVFCDAIDPDPDHGLQHNVQQCYEESDFRQAFTSRDALQQHLSEVHKYMEINHRMQKWRRFREDDKWYWKCGFCELILPRWTERVEHISEHFSDGAVMSSWDPRIQPHPLNKASLNCALSLSPTGWDAATLLDLERQRRDFPLACEPKNLYRCEHCDFDFCFRTKKDAERHDAIWHCFGEVWSCPTMNDVKAGNLAPYFFATEEDPACPYCDRAFSSLAESCPDLDISDFLDMHLRVGHRFDGCQPVYKSASQSELLLHLANIHKISVSYLTPDVLESCRQELPPLVKAKDM